jgi:hypothetical protein
MTLAVLIEQELLWWEGDPACLVTYCCRLCSAVAATCCSFASLISQNKYNLPTLCLICRERGSRTGAWEVPSAQHGE